MPADREIPKNPQDIPVLNDEAIQLITELCFRNNSEVKKVDAVLVFGSYDTADLIAQKVEELIDHSVSEDFILLGGASPYRKIGPEGRECDLMYQAISDEYKERANFILETKSQNTLENVLFAKEFYDLGVVKTGGFVLKSRIAGRGFLTLKKYYPNIDWKQFAYDACLPDGGTEVITRSNWFEHEQGRQGAWGEYLRIKKYGGRGDIEFDSVEDTVAKIAQLTGLE